MVALSLRDRRHFKEVYLESAMEADLIEMTIPDKPTSGNQRYRLTAKGRAWLATRKAGEET
jgi:ATP-dependent DNA helicase RecG